MKRDIEDQLAGRVVEQANTAKQICNAVDLFITDKRVEGISEDVLRKYTRELEPVRDFVPV